MLMQSWLRGVQSLLKRSRRMSRVTRRRQRAEGAVSAEVLEVRSLLAANITATLAEGGGENESHEDPGKNAAQTNSADDGVSANTEVEAVTETTAPAAPIQASQGFEVWCGEWDVGDVVPSSVDPEIEYLPPPIDPSDPSNGGEPGGVVGPMAGSNKNPEPSDPTNPVSIDPEFWSKVEPGSVDPGFSIDPICIVDPIEISPPIYIIDPIPIEMSVGNTPGWTGSTTQTGNVEVVTSTGTMSVSDGSPFVLLTAGDPNQSVTLSHTFFVHPGDVVSGSSYFHAGDYMPWDDSGGVRILDADGHVVAEMMTSSVSAVGDFGQTGWISWQFVAQFEGVISVEAWVMNAGDDLYDSQVGLANFQVISDWIDVTPPTANVDASEIDNTMLVTVGDTEEPSGDGLVPESNQTETPSDLAVGETLDSDLETKVDTGDEEFFETELNAAFSATDWIDGV